MLASLERSLIVLGAALIVAGILIVVKVRLLFLEDMPGDIRIERGNFRFCFPIVWCIVVSALVKLTLILLARKWWHEQGKSMKTGVIAAQNTEYRGEIV
jgi:hypothetical protein